MIVAKSKSNMMLISTIGRVITAESKPKREILMVEESKVMKEPRSVMKRVIELIAS